MSWRACKLGEFLDVKHGYAFKGEHFTDAGEFVLLTPGNCHESGGLKLKGEKEKYYTGEFPPEYLLDEGALIVVMTDLVNTAPVLGGAFTVPESGKFLHNQRLGLVQITNEKRIQRDFLFYLLNSRVYRAQVRGSASGATVRHTSPGRIKDCTVRIPDDLKQQKRIADILSAYDALMENNRRRMALLEESARLLYREWFVRLRFPGHERTRFTNGVPADWRKGTVGDFYETSSGGTPSRTNADFFIGEIPWVKTQELPNGFITDTHEKISEAAIEKSAAKLFPKHTLLVALYGATIGELGILAMPAATNQACCAVIPLSPHAHYIHAFLFFRENKEKLVNLSAGAAQKNISQQIVRGFEMIMPRPDLLAAFVEILAPSFEQWLNLHLQNQKLRTARDHLLPRLMSGELAV